LNTDTSIKLKIAPHRIIPDKDHSIVEHLLTGEFYEMPQPAIEAIEALARGISPEQIELELRHKYPDEEIKMVDFLAQLEDMGFLSSEEDPSVASYELNPTMDGAAPSNRISRIGQLLFSKNAILVYALLFCANVVFFISRPDLFPQPRDLFPFNSMVLNIVVSFVISIVLLAIHESGHVLAGRSYGLTSRVRLGHRLFLPVIETQMPTIWRLPRGRRNVPLLAGLFMDHTLLFISLSILVVIPSISGMAAGILGMIVLQLIMMSMYQCMFFMKTDLYYLLQNTTGSYNLLENAEGWLKGKLPFIRRESTTVIYDKEWNIVRGYAVVYLFGLLASFAVFSLYVIPQLSYSFAISFDRLINPTSTSMIADALLFYAQFLVYSGLLMYSWSKKFTVTQHQ